MLKIELITNYFPPEMGAAASRMYNLAKGLQDLNYDVEVIAPLPNYPDYKIKETYKNTFKRSEYIGGVKVKRVWVSPPSSKNKLIRFLQILSFPITMWTTLFHLIKKKPNIIIIQNTPLWVSFSATILSIVLSKNKRILNVSDLWPLTAVTTSLITDKGLKYRVMAWIEQFNYRHSDLIMGQSNEILHHIGDKTDNPLFLYRNIIPDYHDSEIDTNKYHHEHPKIVYAGLLSPVQSVYAICKSINFQKTGAEFHIYGSGEEQKLIEAYIQNNPDCNIYYHGRVSRAEMHQKLPSFHASIVPLVNRIYGAVPSKIFELIACGVPVLFCGGGEGAELIRKNNLGYLSEPRDMQSLEENIQRLILLSPEEYKMLLTHCIEFTLEKLNFKKQLHSLSHNINAMAKNNKAESA